ncbi:DUF2071 domain-containing protein [Sphingobacterium sp. lm-10]|uniref:DUF2071 domain-containing protein n=1 Tax=Sphingobacterium sp. lm-10 TaxID=2944904 RepID=UPI00202158BD|nr:DUF2071 domain-containing protein [Sphingobacterium sp. lm-10]MCL7986571.1 DUF2071 domain-containing protein [Sphingobacterium sp. lm-10]
MIGKLKNHPFPVKAHFDESVVLTFAVPKEQLQPLIPERMQLDTYQDQWAFVAVALVQTSRLRPAIFPGWMGHNFFLIGYRIFVRYTNRAGKRLRGLYILKSQTDTWKMTFLGNLFTHYQYEHIDINRSSTGNIQHINSNKSNFHLSWNSDGKEHAMPSGSPFDNWKEARKFAGPLPHTFSSREAGKSVLIVEGKRQDWIPTPIEVLDYQIGFLDYLKLEEIVLASAFKIDNVPYSWNKGILELW